MLSADLEIFEQTRPKLMGLAYRLLGSISDAEDAVQDTFLKWANAAREEIESAPAWLTTICTRRCLDLLGASNRARVDYVGAWLPEPIHTSTDSASEAELELATSLKTAFLLMLERLTPKERAAYLLHEIFGTPYVEIAEALDIKEAACRKLVSRAKANIQHNHVRTDTSTSRQDELLSAFQMAIVDGETAQLAGLLSADIRLTADGGGKVPTLLEELHGVAEVTTFLREQLHQYWAGHRWETVDLNGARGAVITQEGATTASVSFAYDELGKVTNIYIVRNPQKLQGLRHIDIH